MFTTLSRDSPKAVLAVAGLLVNVGSPPLGFDRVIVFPEVDEEVGDLACRWQQTLQVECVVAGEAEASCRYDGCPEPQTLFRTDRQRERVRQWRGGGGDKTCSI